MEISYINSHGNIVFDYEFKNFKLRNISKDLDSFSKLLNLKDTDFEKNMSMIEDKCKNKNISVLNNTSNTSISKEDYLNKFKDSKFIKYLNKNKKYIIPALVLCTVGFITLTGVDANASTREVINCFSQNNAMLLRGIGDGFKPLEDIFAEVLGLVKKILVYSVIINGVRNTITILWNDAGGNLSWTQIFGTVFKNLAILGVGLALDGIAWNMYRQVTQTTAPLVLPFLLK